LGNRMSKYLKDISKGAQGKGGAGLGKRKVTGCLRRMGTLIGGGAPV